MKEKKLKKLKKLPGRGSLISTPLFCFCLICWAIVLCRKFHPPGRELLEPGEKKIRLGENCFLRICFARPRGADLAPKRATRIVPKKIVRLATSRNRHKRVIKEQFRLVKKCLPNVDIVLLLNQRVCEEELMRSCERIWNFLTHEIDD